MIIRFENPTGTEVMNGPWMFERGNKSNCEKVS